MGLVLLLDGQFQVRPWKEFSSIRGVNKLLSLPFLTSGHQFEEESDPPEELAEPRNAYEFMRSVKGSAHPTLIRWIAAVRLNNFALDETKVPLCVRLEYDIDTCTLTLDSFPPLVHF
jgi:hypothetical protein